MKITKAVIPAAGLGTRFLPFTKSIPKELVPIMEKPALHLIIEEGLASGIKEFEIIINDDKPAINNYFSPNNHLETLLHAKNKDSLIAGVNNLIHNAHLNYIAQPKPLGLGHAILMAQEKVGDEYFGIFLPDEIMMDTTPALSQLIAKAQQYNCSIVAVQKVPREKVSSYGIVSIKQNLEKNLFEIDKLIEKPSINHAPSTLAIIGRYVLSPTIFASLKNTQAGAGNEIQLTDGITHMMNNGERVLAYNITTHRYDVGNPLDWLKANIAYALSQPLYATEIKHYLSDLQKK